MRNGSLTVNDFHLYDENSSSKGRSQASQLSSSLPKQMIALLADEFIASWLIVLRTLHNKTTGEYA